jgi:monoamine oxidase
LADISRRRFLNLVGSAGGAAAVYETMAAMGLLRPPEAYAGPPRLSGASAAGSRVVVLGAGIAGLTAAYELAKGGYAVTILEARERCGGRSWTLRRGDMVHELDSAQTCAFDAEPEMYFNAGAARISQHHRAILGYCRELGVELQPVITDNRNAYYQSDDAFAGRPVRARQFVSDSRGYVAELLAKAIDQGALDQDLTAADREVFLEVLRNFGALRGDRTYQGSSRAGYQEWPGAGATRGTLLAPLDRTALFRSAFATTELNLAELIDFAPPMLQPVGGMDRIATAFERRLHPHIHYAAAVSEIRRQGSGARVAYRDGRTGRSVAIDADYCICTIPLPVLAGIPADFSPRHKQAIAGSRYLKAVKLAFQADRRFWEDDDIYGGTSWTTEDITQIWYPSTGFQGRKGILVGAYAWTDDVAERFGALRPEERNRAAVASGAKIHPEYAAHVSRGLSVAWHKIPYSLGAYARPTFDNDYRALLEPDGPIHFAGDHLSYLVGWQEGAVLSAHAAVSGIDLRVRAGRN